MGVTSLGQTLKAVGADRISGESLSKPLGKAVDKLLNVLSFGIYGAYKSAVASEMKNALLDLGKSIIKWDPDNPDVPVTMKMDGRDYEISDMPEGGIRLFDCTSATATQIDGVSLSSIRDMIFSDLMNNPDFSAAMDHRLYEDATVQVDILGLKQERANACGEASRNMILAYHGVDYAPATNSRDLFEGRARNDIVDELRGKGLDGAPVKNKEKEEYSCEEIQQGLKNGPLLCELQGHMVVVHGVNAMLDRVHIFCPLLGNRHASLSDFNSKLDWNQRRGEAPLMHFHRVDATVLENSGTFGKSTDADFSPGIIDRLGVAVLAKGYAIGNSWLKAPEDFANTP